MLMFTSEEWMGAAAVDWMLRSEQPGANQWILSRALTPIELQMGRNVPGQRSRDKGEIHFLQGACRD